MESVNIAGTTIHYAAVDSGRDETCKNALYRLDNNDLVIQAFEHIPTSTMTKVMILDGEIIDKDCLYYLLPCPKYEKCVNYESGTIVGLRWKNMCKGKYMREFKNSICVYITKKGNDCHAKLSSKKPSNGDSYTNSHKIQMVGVKCQADAVQLSNKLVNYMRDAYQVYCFIRNNVQLFQDAANWLDSYCSKSVPNRSVVDSSGPCIIYEVTYHKELIWPFDEDVPDVLYQAISILKERFTDCICITSLFDRLDYIFRLSSVPCSANISIKDTFSAMYNINFFIGMSVDCGLLTEFLNQMHYNASFIDEIMDYIQVKTRDRIEDDTNSIIRRGGGLENCFEIMPTGAIKHSGTGGTSMKSNYIHMMVTICHYIVIHNYIHRLPLALLSD